MRFKVKTKHTINVQQFHAANGNSKTKSFLLYTFEKSR